MLIIKKNGKLEEFDIDKILRSVEKSAEDVSIFLNTSDLKLLKKDIISKINKLKRSNKLISTYEIKGIVIDVLKEFGFKKIIKSYLNLDN